MKTHTHTPGPWKVLEHARGIGRTCVSTTNESPIQAIICDIDVKSVKTGEAMRLSNARLIAAAPELLQVTRDFLLLAALHDWEGAAIDFAKATLAKAEGNA
jgi:hypothetical protein